MIKFIFSNTQKRENKNTDLFLNFYVRNRVLKTLTVTCVTEGTIKSPDYLLKKLSLAIEVKEVHDLIQNKKSAQWGKVINNLQTAIEKDSLFNQIRGSYLINTPPNIKMRSDSTGVQQNAFKIIQRILNGDKKFTIDNIPFEAIKVNDKDNGILFGTSDGGSYDPASTIHQNIFKQMRTANGQLANVPSDYKKIVLLVNKYQKVHWGWDIFKALSYMFSDLRSYGNIDEVWFQNEGDNNKVSHKLIYRRGLFDQLETKLTKYKHTDKELFASWFSSLQTLGEDKKIELLEGLKILLKSESSSEAFKDPISRSEIARFGTWIIDEGLFKDAVWFVKKFINDTDPAEPKSETEQSKGLDYHNKILSGKKDVYAIVSVLGHLAWVVQKLAVHEETLLDSFRFTKRLLDHKNLYVKLQALIPLIEITRRRELIKNKDPNKAADLHNLLFNLLEKYSKYPALARGLVQVFYHYKNLNSKDALNVVQKLKNTDESAPIIIFLALFRKRHFKEMGKFNDAPLVNELKNIISSDNEELKSLKDSVLWNFWKLLKDEPKEFLTLKPFIDLFVSGKYDNRATHTLVSLIDDWIDREPKVCIEWFLSLLIKACEYAENNKPAGRDIWFEPELAVMYISKNDPQKLLEAMWNLIGLWKNYSYIGNPKELFESYKNINDPKLKKKTKEQFKSWHEEMISINPKITPVDWEL